MVSRLNSNFWRPSRAFVGYQADQWVSDLRPGIAGPTFWSRRFDPGQDTRDGMETRVNYWEVVTGLSIIFYHRVINRPVPDCLPAPSTGAWRDSDDIFTRIIYQTQQTPVINPMPVKCWASVADTAPTFNRRWVIAPCLPAREHFMRLAINWRCHGSTDQMTAIVSHFTRSPRLLSHDPL